MRVDAPYRWELTHHTGESWRTIQVRVDVPYRWELTHHKGESWRSVEDKRWPIYAVYTDNPTSQDVTHPPAHYQVSGHLLAEQVGRSPSVRLTDGSRPAGAACSGPYAPELITTERCTADRRLNDWPRQVAAVSCKQQTSVDCYLLGRQITVKMHSIIFFY